MPDLEILAQIWVGADDGSLERAVVEVERTDLDEVRIGMVQSVEKDEWS